MEAADLYAGREHMRIKHIILEKYLERLAHIVLNWASSLTYVDGFSGPWKVKAEDYSDSSFALALTQLRRAQKTLADRGKNRPIRCYFLEKRASSHKKLQAFCEKITDVEVVAERGEFEARVSDIHTFIRKVPNTFPFIFIDPTGWTGFAMDLIEPLLNLGQGEVLINFQSQFMKRFITAKATAESYRQLFGDESVRERLAALPLELREEALVREYCAALKARGKYTYVIPTVILDLTDDKTNYHLIYGTRHPKGLEVFKNVERKAVPEMTKSRGAIKERESIASTDQPSLLAPEEMHQLPLLHQIQDRNLGQARAAILRVLAGGENVPYKKMWETALQYPFVWRQDLNDWIDNWKKKGDLTVTGLKSPRSKPDWDGKVVLRWTGKPLPERERS